MIRTIEVVTEKHQEFVDITGRVQAAVREAGISEGVVHLYCPHTTAGICINENYDPTVVKDVLTKLEELFRSTGYTVMPRGTLQRTSSRAF